MESRNFKYVSVFNALEVTRINLEGVVWTEMRVQGHSLGCINIFAEDPGELMIRTVREVFELGRSDGCPSAV